MANHLRAALLGSVLIVVSACASAPAKQDEGDMPEITAPEPISAAEICMTKGGRYGPAGKLGANRCTLPYSDAGTVCTDSAECQGQCLAGDFDAAGYEGTGQCQADDSPFGCNSEIIGGIVQPGLCVD